MKQTFKQLQPAFTLALNLIPLHPAKRIFIVTMASGSTEASIISELLALARISLGSGMCGGRRPLALAPNFPLVPSSRKSDAPEPPIKPQHLDMGIDVERDRRCRRRRCRRSPEKRQKVARLAGRCSASAYAARTVRANTPSCFVHDRGATHGQTADAADLQPQRQVAERASRRSSQRFRRKRLLSWRPQRLAPAAVVSCCASRRSSGDGHRSQDRSLSVEWMYLRLRPKEEDRHVACSHEAACAAGCRPAPAPGMRCES